MAGNAREPKQVSQVSTQETVRPPRVQVKDRFSSTIRKYDMPCRGADSAQTKSPEKPKK